MTRLNPADRARCEELAIAPGRPFDVALRFIGPDDAEPALALEALFSILRELPWSVSDPTPGLAQLAWWQEEIACADARGSQHPVVRALRDSGALAALRGDVWAGYLRDLGEQVTNNVVVDRIALGARLQAIAGREAELLAVRSESELPVGILCAGASAVRLLGLLSRLDPKRPKPAWVPLDLVARHAASSTELPEVAADLAETGLSWINCIADVKGNLGSGARLVYVQALLAQRLLRQLRARPASRLARGADRVGPVDLISAWWRVRRIAMPTEESPGHEKTGM